MVNINFGAYQKNLHARVLDSCKQVFVCTAVVPDCTLYGTTVIVKLTEKPCADTVTSCGPTSFISKSANRL